MHVCFILKLVHWLAHIHTRMQPNPAGYRTVLERIETSDHTLRGQKPEQLAQDPTMEFTVRMINNICVGSDAGGVTIPILIDPHLGNLNISQLIPLSKCPVCRFAE